MTSLRTLLLACLLDSKDSPCPKKQFSYLDLWVTANRKALFYHVGDMRIGTIPPADVTQQLIFSFSLFNSLLQSIKRICLPNSSAIDNFCNNIIVSHFWLILSCNWKMSAQLFGSKVHCLCRHLRTHPNLPTWNFFWKDSAWSQQAKNQPDWTSFKLQGEQTSSRKCLVWAGLKCFFEEERLFSPYVLIVILF